MNYNSTPSRPNATTTVDAPTSGPDQAKDRGLEPTLATNLLPRDQEFLYITAITKSTSLTIKDPSGDTISIGAIPTPLGLSSPIICLSFTASAVGDILYYVQ